MKDLIRSRTSRLTAVLATVAVSLGLAAGPAAAQNSGNQNGLVNVNVQDVLNGNQVAIQAPIGVVANVCGVNVGIIQDARRAGAPVNCNASNEQATEANFPAPFQSAAGDNRGNQRGLVNVNVQDVLTGNQVAIQAPIGVVANVCGVNVGVIQDARRAGAPIDCNATNDQATTADFRS